MTILRTVAFALAGLLILVGCENLPGTREQQSTAAGGAAGAAVGAAVADNNLLGALLGGLAGAAGGRLIGAHTDWFQQDQDYRQSQAQAAIESARMDPASAADVPGSTTADLNDDGFVTSDEVIAMEDAGISDQEILDRLRATNQVFQLSDEQRQNFLSAGVSADVVNQLDEINREERDRILSDPEVISSPA
ncbi:MAG: hypothetical protein WD180_01210 [Pseudohongiellaceae bacterium]